MKMIEDRISPHNSQVYIQRHPPLVCQCKATHFEILPLKVLCVLRCWWWRNGDRERSRDAKDASNEKSEEENLQSIIQRTGATFLLAALRVNFGEIWNDLDVQSKDARMKGCGASSRIHYEVLILYVVCWFWPLAGETGAACMYRTKHLGAQIGAKAYDTLKEGMASMTTGQSEVA